MSDPVDTKRPGRGLKIALILSLGLNFLIIGTIAGFVAVGKSRWEQSGPPVMRAIGLGPILPALDGEDRQALFSSIRDNRDRLAEGGRSFGRSVRGFTESLRAEPFDRAAAEAALLAQRDHGAAMQAEGHALLLDQIEGMSAEARAALADRIEQRLRRSLDRRVGGPEGR